MELAPELHTQLKELIKRGKRKDYEIEIMTKMGTFVLVIDGVMFRCHKFEEIETILALLVDHKDLMKKEKKRYEQTELKFKSGVISLNI